MILTTVLPSIMIVYTHHEIYKCEKTIDILYDKNKLNNNLAVGAHFSIQFMAVK